VEPLPDAAAWRGYLGKEGDLVVVADNFLLAASSHGSVVGLGTNDDEQEKKWAAHVWVPVRAMTA